MHVKLLQILKLAFSFNLGEGQDVPNEMTALCTETTLPNLISRCDSRDIYNADEFGFFYKGLPTKSMHLKGEKSSGGKNGKIQLTGLAAAYMCGENIPIYALRKSSKPRCSKEIKTISS